MYYGARSYPVFSRCLDMSAPDTSPDPDPESTIKTRWQQLGFSGCDMPGLPLGIRLFEYPGLRVVAGIALGQDLLIKARR